MNFRQRNAYDRYVYIEAKRYLTPFYLKKKYGGIWNQKKFGTVPHCGFELGFERLMLFVTGMRNIRDVIPFPQPQITQVFNPTQWV